MLLSFVESTRVHEEPGLVPQHQRVLGLVSHCVRASRDSAKNTSLEDEGDRKPVETLVARTQADGLAVGGLRFRELTCVEQSYAVRPPERSLGR